MTEQNLSLKLNEPIAVCPRCDAHFMTPELLATVKEYLSVELAVALELFREQMLESVIKFFDHPKYPLTRAPIQDGMRKVFRALPTPDAAEARRIVEDAARLNELLAAAIAFQRYANNRYNEEPCSCVAIHCSEQQRLWRAIDTARQEPDRG